MDVKRGEFVKKIALSSLSLLSLLFFSRPLAAQYPPKVWFAGTWTPGGRADLVFQDVRGSLVHLFISRGVLGSPFQTPWGAFYLDASLLPAYSGTMPSDRLVLSFPIPNQPWLVGLTFWAQGLSWSNGLSNAASFKIQAGGGGSKVFKVLVLNFDPVIESRGGKRLHQVAGWNDPAVLLAAYLKEMKAVSGGFVSYKVTAKLDLDVWPKKADGFSYTDQSYLNCLSTGKGWHQPDLVDYGKIIKDYGLAAKVKSGQVDEVILFGGPYFGYYESRMAGPGAYWCNSPGMPSVPSGRKFVIMGFNYERGLAEMMHSYGHRAESIMMHVYGGWNAANPRTNWDLFTRYDKIAPGKAACGNIHFPPNGVRDYDYANPNPVWSTAADWLRNWPNLKGTRTLVTCKDWGCSQLGYMKWWYRHLPARPGVNLDGRQNNWWKYIQDFNSYPYSR